MSTASPRQHARTGPAEPQPEEPTHAERIRTLAAGLSTGTLSTLSRKHPGFPFGSLMPFALDATGRPLFLISNMAMHTQNLRADPRASLFINQIAAADGDPLGSARATLVGEATSIPPDEPNAIASARKLYLAAHENSRYWVDFADFSFFRLTPIDLYYVGGFGVMGWVAAEDYAIAEPDPLLTSAAAILSHMNADHLDAMLLLARTHAGLTAAATGLTATAADARMTSDTRMTSDARMTSIDRLGFTLRLTTSDGIKALRINYPAEARTPTAVRQAIVAMVEQARIPALASMPRV